MNYPVIILFRNDKYSDIDMFFERNKKVLLCTTHITNNKDELNKLFNPNYHILITYGNNEKEYVDDVMSIIAPRMTNRWIHKTTITDVEEFNYNVNYCYINNVIEIRKHTRPIFSIFSTCYNSYQKIHRAYNSILAQTFNDWEWVIMDDSPDDAHFNYLREQLGNDNRIRLYKRDKNSGNIGNVKNEVCGLCRGQYILELDHDDEIMPHLLSDAVNIFENDSNIGFVYTDFINMYEDERPFKYDEPICKGYGSYYKQKYNGNWHNVYITPNINNITLTHLVCCPNHARIWRKSTLDECEGYSEFLYICDDYELLLRTCINTKVAKLNKMSYIQYMNDNNNNFSLIRGSEINRIGPKYISPMFYSKYDVHSIMKNNDAYEDEHYIHNHSKIWERTSYKHKYYNKST